MSIPSASVERCSENRSFSTVLNCNLAWLGFAPTRLPTKITPEAAPRRLPTELARRMHEYEVTFRALFDHRVSQVTHNYFNSCVIKSNLYPLTHFLTPFLAPTSPSLFRTI